MALTNPKTDAEGQLNRVLSFFQRADAKGSALLGIGLGMLAFLAVNAPPFTKWDPWLLFATIPVLLIFVSIWHVYQAAYPVLEGGEKSLIYFREVATLTEPNYVKQFRNLSDDDLVDDLLGQAWRNSQILKVKFDHLKWAHTLVAVAVVPWIASLVLLVIRYPIAGQLLRK